MLFIQWEEDTKLFVFEFALLALRGDRDQGHPTAVLGKGWGKGQTAQRGKRVGLAFGNMALVGPRLSHAQCPVTHNHGGPPSLLHGGITSVWRSRDAQLRGRGPTAESHHHQNPNAPRSPSSSFNLSSLIPGERKGGKYLRLRCTLYMYYFTYFSKHPYI